MNTSDRPRGLSRAGREERTMETITLPMNPAREWVALTPEERMEPAKLRRQLADLAALREADQATIASLGLVTTSLADALETVHLRMDRWAVGDVQPGRKGKDSDMPLLRRRIEAALRTAGRLLKGENDA